MYETSHEGDRAGLLQDSLDCNTRNTRYRVVDLTCLMFRRVRQSSAYLLSPCARRARFIKLNADNYLILFRHWISLTSAAACTKVAYRKKWSKFRRTVVYEWGKPTLRAGNAFWNTTMQWFNCVPRYDQTRSQRSHDQLNIVLIALTTPSAWSALPNSCLIMQNPLEWISSTSWLER